MRYHRKIKLSSRLVRKLVEASVPFFPCYFKNFHLNILNATFDKKKIKLTKKGRRIPMIMIPLLMVKMRMMMRKTPMMRKTRMMRTTRMMTRTRIMAKMKMMTKLMMMMTMMIMRKSAMTMKKAMNRIREMKAIVRILRLLKEKVLTMFQCVSLTQLWIPALLG